MSELQTPSVSKSPSSSNAADVSICSYGLCAPAVEYAVDAAQRSILFWDVMRERGNQYHAHLAETAPHVLDYGFELIVDGRQLKRRRENESARRVDRVVPEVGRLCETKRGELIAERSEQ